MHRVLIVDSIAPAGEQRLLKKAEIIRAPDSDPETIRRLLVEQVTGMVRWRESVLRLKAEGVSRLVELGAGKVLAGLAKRIDKDVEAAAVGQPTEVDVILKTL